ncbi:MltA domain-containing protein [Breoghania sp. L-A4]|uniref:murein transglycosylase A n=1 Tax=Breoghania sp. L-A4 TaxID=2304600 RepID=UPI000E35D43A|nr:MltA domain-containing protein [Breoghania sp. L-A4]AXS42349.1 transglycosylase [Breoghania sp. L-A4]
MTHGSSLTPVRFEALAGWAEDNHAAALEAFRTGCGARSDAAPASGVEALRIQADLCARALRVAENDGDAARRFFEDHFLPLRVDAPGFVTGYFEPEIAGARTRSSRFQVPLYAAPTDLVRLDETSRPQVLDPALQFARRTKDGLVEHPDRAAIEAGALKDRGLEIVWVEDPIDAFFIHIQGSARIRLQDGSLMRIAYAAKSGHPYTPIGRLLIERGAIARDDMSMERLRDWLRDNPDEARALMQANRSYIFFREVAIADPSAGPIGAAGVSLTAARSIAIDPAFYAYGTPIFVTADLPEDTTGTGQPFRHLMIAQDTGSAIKGPARGDLYLGSGEAAGLRAGRIRHAAEFVRLVPRGSRLAREAERERK